MSSQTLLDFYKFINKLFYFNIIFILFLTKTPTLFYHYMHHLSTKRDPCTQTYILFTCFQTDCMHYSFAKIHILDIAKKILMCNKYFK